MEKVRQPAYLYFFSYVGERRRGQAPGARHGAEIPFVFDQFPAAIRLLATAEDCRMAETVSAYWVPPCEDNPECAWGFLSRRSVRGKEPPAWIATDNLLI